MTNILDMIENEKWREGKFFKGYKSAIRSQNASCDRIANVAKQPRTMKRWTDDCKPEKPGMFWLRDLDGGIYVNYVSIHMIESYGVDLFTHWRELEQAPILPKDGE